MAWRVRTEWGWLHEHFKEDLPSLDAPFVTGDEYEEVETPSVNESLNDKYMQEMMTIVQAFYQNIQDNEVSVKMLETVSESLLTSMKQSMETQLFVLKRQKNEINRSDRGKIEKMREVDRVQEEIDRIENELENLHLEDATEVLQND